MYAAVMGTRDKHPVTFTCEHCGWEKTELHGPGPLPRYCQACYNEAQRHLNKMRVQAHRERQKAAQAARVAPRSTEERSR